MILGLFTDLLSTGGVQYAGRQTAAVLASASEKLGSSYRFLSLNDPGGDHEFSISGQQLTFHGFARDKIGFVAATVRAATQRPQIILAGHPHLAPPAIAAGTVSTRARVAVMSHGVEVWRPMSHLRREALRRADLVTAPSTDTAQKLIAVQKLNEARVVRLPWSLDDGFWNLIQAAHQSPAPSGFPSGRIVLTVGRWAASERYKGLDHLIQATAELSREISDLQLVAIGEGDDLPHMRALAQQMGVPARVHFLSGLSRAEIAASYARSDVFALPSAGEGFGLVFLEAMAAGKPVIGGAHGGTLDLIEEGKVGYLVRHGDVARLSSLLRNLILDDQLRHRLGSSGCEFVRSNFLFPHFQMRLMRLLDPACES